MKTKISPAAVGMFILGALSLFVVLFLSFGGSNVFTKPSRFLIYFDESVSGLDPGAPLKFSVGRQCSIMSSMSVSARQLFVKPLNPWH